MKNSKHSNENKTKQKTRNSPDTAIKYIPKIKYQVRKRRRGEWTLPPDATGWCQLLGKLSGFYPRIHVKTQNKFKH